MEDGFALLLKKPGLGIVVSDGIKNCYLFVSDSKEPYELLSFRCRPLGQ